MEGLRNTPPAPGEERVLYPGLLGGELRQKRLAEGIGYHPEVHGQHVADRLIDEGGAATVKTVLDWMSSTAWRFLHYRSSLNTTRSGVLRTISE